MSAKAYDFKSITVVPSGKEFIDIVLSRTQRQTPTVVHKHYKISRIRAFYTRKVKYTQQNFHDKLTSIIEEFPKFDDVHPFYADLMNVLYDKDHFKLALGQINTCRHLIDGVAKEYVRLLKYGDTLYRCKQLKRAAMGRMCTIMKRQSNSLAYLEQVRQHLSRLPSIDPNTRTLLMTGFPNVGKSSFVNKITRADVDVQPYAFTTKSLFVGHADYRYIRWQVIDTPGILDHPLEDRNTIEMQAITAMAHLRALVIYVMDLSEQCGHTVDEQLKLFESIRPLFANKPHVIVVNKVDIVPIEKAPEHVAKAFEQYKAEGIDVLPMSAMTEEGVMTVKEAACEKLLASRIEVKLQGKKLGDNLNRLHVATPKPRDEKVREPFIPPGALNRRKVKQPIKTKGRGMIDESELPDPDELKRRTLKDLEMELREEYSTDLRAEWDLKNPDQKYDDIPEIMDGKNVADFIDPEILEKLDALEREEEAREAAGFYEAPVISEERQETRKLAKAIRAKKADLRVKSWDKRAPRNHPRMPPKLLDAIAKRTEAKKALEKAQAERAGGGDGATNSSRMDTSDDSQSRGREVKKRKRGSSRDISRGNSASVDPHNRSLTPSRAIAGLKDDAQIKRARVLKHRGQAPLNALGKIGESDRMYKEKMPKHLFSGKRKQGKTQRR
eukprot:m.16821 g.16821  ORF g.16821 m.16821 type:complete len:668 (-) comp5814_c0_seq1:167-2170(-)